MKKTYNHNHQKRKDMMKSTERSYDEIFGDISGKEEISSEQKTELKIFSSQLIQTLVLI